MKKIAIPTRNNLIDNHFGHCDHYTIYTIANNNTIVSELTLESPQGCGCKSDIAQTLRQMGVSVMIAGNMGNGAYCKLTEQGISVLRGCSGPIADAIAQYIAGTLADSAEACDHHDCDHHSTSISATNIKLAL